MEEKERALVTTLSETVRESAEVGGTRRVPVVVNGTGIKPRHRSHREGSHLGYREHCPPIQSFRLEIRQGT